MLDFLEMPGHLIRRLHQISASIFAERVAEAGFDITPVQFAALCVLEDSPGVDQVTLAGMIAYDRVTIGGVVDRLEQKGLLTRTVSARDRRARELHITEAGVAVQRAILPIVRAAQEVMLSGLGEDERAAFLAMLRTLTEAGNERSRAPLRLK
jgi:MarR family transcriptional regulator, temperature-dependent positive regulator of motility